MGDRDFRFKLDCAPQDVTPKALSQAVSAFARILSAADASDWRISRMELHSIDLAAKPVVVDERTERSFATLDTITVLLQCLFDRFGSVFPQCGLMVFPGVVIVSR
jgi:hypothetical protein